MSKKSALEPMLRKLSYWSALDDEDQGALLALPHRTKTVDAHHYIVREREKATHCCVMLSGFSIHHMKNASIASPGSPLVSSMCRSFS